MDKLLRNVIILGIFLVSISASFYFFSKSDFSIFKNEAKLDRIEEAVKRDFTESMNLRIVGDCDSFANSVSRSDPKIREEWGERCRREKTREAVSIEDFSILRVSVDNEKAFVQIVRNVC